VARVAQEENADAVTGVPHDAPGRQVVRAQPATRPYPERDSPARSPRLADIQSATRQHPERDSPVGLAGQSVAWMGPSRSASRVPLPPQCRAIISAAIDTAVSSGVRAPRS